MTQLGNPVSIPFPFRLATWNLRYDVQPDNIPVATSLAALPDPRVAPPPVPPGEQPWSARRVRVAQRLCASLVDLVGAFRNGRSGKPPFLLLMIACLCILLGFQEALVRQVHDLEELLGSESAWVRAFFSRSFLTHRTYYITLLFLVIDFSAMSFIELELQVGVGRDDGVSAGEFNPIFYRR